MVSLLSLDRLSKHTFDVLDDKIDRLIMSSQQQGGDCLVELMQSTQCYVMPEMQDKLVERLQIIDERIGNDRFAQWQLRHVMSAY